MCFCKGPHPIFRCNKFSQLELYQRQDQTKKLKLCFGCLFDGHLAASCTWQTCRNCNGARHHRLLCPKSSVVRSLHIGKPKSNSSKSQVFNISAELEADSLQVIGTVLFKLKQSGNSNTGSIRALCDSGSQVNLMTEDCVQRWMLQRKPLKLSIVGVGAPIFASGCVDAQVVNRTGESSPLSVRFMIVPNISGHNPQRHFRCPLSAHLSVDELADPTFDCPSRVDALIGVGTWTEIMQEKIIKCTDQGQCFVAHKSILGWVISGSTWQSVEPVSLSFHVASSDGDLDAQLERFWAVDDFDQGKMYTPDEQRAEDNFISTHVRDESGRYVVTIPFREDALPLGQSRNTALNRFVALERRLAKPGNEQLLEAFREFMQDYITAGHLVLAPPAPKDTSQAYYIPYHIIHKNKFRVVFDASCATSSGVSLNDIQLPGPKLQADLNITMLRFRTYRYALTANIVKMYRQVKVSPDQHDFQRILFRMAESEPVREYVITRVIWGFTSAPFNAIRALQQCAKDEGSYFPTASSATMNNFYMDDLLWGSDTVQGLRERQAEIIGLLKRGGFVLAKWASNNVEMAEELGQTDTKCFLQNEAGVLGMVWNTRTDNLHIKVKESLKEVSSALTKRRIISSISQVYDPTGLFIPVIVKGKMIIQDIRKLNLGWDEEVPETIKGLFDDFIAEVAKLAETPVPRWLGSSSIHQVQLHIFSDASERAYGACAYIRASLGGQSTVRLVTARNKVAPIKTQTVPRLELMGAVMSVELAKVVTEACGIEGIETHFWTDSTIVLHWLRKDVTALKPFVAHRVSIILRSAEIREWHHVPGTQNPADLISRGCSADYLKSSEIWWKGPNWLGSSQKSWPALVQTLSQEDIGADEKESKMTRLVGHINQKVTLPLAVNVGNISEPLDSRVSTINQLVRITAFVFRFVSKCRLKRAKRAKRMETFDKVPALTPAERDHSLFYWIKQAQAQDFFEERKALLDKRYISPGSKLAQLYPFVDGEGVLRVGGRLGESNLPRETKHQVILHHSSTLAKLIIKDAHNHFVHGGTQLTMAYVRQRFWITRLRQAAKKVVNECVTCIRFRKEQAQQLMGALPSVRTDQTYPFLRSGVDFAGPFQVRRTINPRMVLRNGRKAAAESSKTLVKCWVVVFVCLVTRAVHLDVAYGLSVEAFLEVFVRFTSRRGQCRELWSDNGTNFVGSNKELQRVKKEWAGEFPHKELANCGTTWRFITPGAPHQGGLWEAAVKSMKHHLWRAMGRRVLSSAQLYTIVTQIECCLNSRPLAPLNDDPSDLEFLSPAHFLIGRPTNFLPAADNVVDKNDNRLTLWGQQQKVYQQFWRRWKGDHLVSLQKRSKWLRPKPNVEVGDMVIIMTDNTPPAYWPIGRVKQVHKGSDDFVRNATILTASGEKLRPVQKLCLLSKEPTTVNNV